MILLIIITLFFSNNSAIPVDSPQNNLFFMQSSDDTSSVDTIYFELDGDTIAIPTMFTPNQENSIAYFYPTFENDDISISQFVINTIEDDWKDVKLMFSSQKLVYKNNTVSHAWDGNDSRNSIEEIKHEGPFRFKFYATKPGSFLKCEGIGYLNRSN